MYSRIKNSLKSPRRYHIAILLVWPLLFFGMSTEWIFTPLGHLDAWIYTGHFIDYPNYIKAFGPNYYQTRLSWIIPGFILHKILPSLAAVVVMHMAVYYACVFSLYIIVSRLVHERMALPAAMLFGGYDWFLAEVATDYVYGANMAYMLLCCLMLLQASRGRRSILYLILAGMAFAGTVHVNIYGISFALPIGVFYLFQKSELSIASIVKDALYVFLGFLLLTFLLGGFNLIVGGDFLFFMPTIQSALDLTSKVTPYKAPLSDYFSQMRWLPIPAAIFAAVLVYLSLSMIRRANKNDSLWKARLSLLLPCVTAVFVTVAWRLFGWHTFYFAFYVSYTLPFMYMALAAMLPDRIKDLSTGAYAFIIFAPVVGLLFFLDGSFYSYLWHPPTVILIMAGCALLIMQGAGFIKGRKTLTALTASFVLVFFVLGFSVTGYSSPGHRVTGYKMIRKVAKAYRNFSPTYSTWWWYDNRVDRKASAAEQGRQQLYSSLFASMTAVHLWGYRTYMDFPVMKQPYRDKFLTRMRRFRPDQKIDLLILSHRPKVFEEARKSMRRMGFMAEYVGRYTFQEDKLTVYVTLIRVNSIASGGR